MATLSPPFTSQQGIFVENAIYTSAASSRQPSTTGNSSNSPPAASATSAESLELVLPAGYINNNKELAIIDLKVPGNLTRYITSELDLTRLNEIHKHLWWTSLERPAQPLHQQRTSGRDIVVTEQADLHLLWQSSRIYVKPLPDFLMCYSIWERFICSDTGLHERASGLLLSYLWLVGHRSDLRVAHEVGLLPRTVTWERWTAFSRAVFERLDYKTLNGINIRFRYGELRLGRVNWIYGLCSKTRTLKTFTRGYRPSYYNYDTFVRRNLAWLVSALVYVGIVLTAMQVGLGTERLQSNASFQRVSYGFTVFSIFTPLVVVVAIAVIVVLLMVDNMKFTLGSAKDWSATVALDNSKH